MGEEAHWAGVTPRLGDMETVHLVTLHGALLDSRSWRPFGEALGTAKGIRRLDVTLPGHSEDPSDISPPTSGEIVEALLPTVSGLGDAPVVLCGHSWGGMVALDFAARHPELVQGLIVIESSWGTATTVWEKIGTAVARALLRLVSPRTLARWSAADYGRHRDTTRQYVEATVGRRTRHQIVAVMQAVFSFDIRDQLEAITQPTLIVVGQRNRRTHNQAKKLAKNLPQASLVSVSGAGHLPMLDNPQETAKFVTQFLHRHFGVETADARHTPAPEPLD